MRPIRITQNPANQSVNNIATSQSVSGAAAMTLASGASSIDSKVGGRIIGIVSAGNDSGITFAVVGVDQNGLAASESITGSSGAPGTAVSVNYYKSITSITTSGSTASTVTVGDVNTTLSTSSAMIPLNSYNRTAAQVAVQVTGTINFTVKETFDPINDGTVTASKAILFSPSALASKTSNTTAPIDVGATGCVVIINSYSSGATLTANIISPSNSDQS